MPSPDMTPMPQPLPVVLVLRHSDGWLVKMLTASYVIALSEKFATMQDAISAAEDSFPGMHISLHVSPHDAGDSDAKDWAPPEPRSPHSSNEP